ncbi:MAG: hypothetical protein IJC46_01020 [Clostridia bacterium]|nr:hypothetical protein [Clostridia bacterium]
MGLFSKSKKQNTSDTAAVDQAPSTSLIRLSAIYEQFDGRVNNDRIYGEKIPALITAYKTLSNNQAPQEEIQKAFLALRNEVIRTVYIVPIRYDAANEFENDRAIHCTSMAANKLNIESIVYRCQNMTMEQMENLAWVKDNTTNRLTVDTEWWDASRIAGSEGYHFEESAAPKTMYPATGSIGDDSFFLCFTGLDQYLKVYGHDKTLHVGLFTINDIVAYMEASDHMRGLILNPDTETHCFIGKEAF